MIRRFTGNVTLLVPNASSDLLLPLSVCNYSQAVETKTSDTEEFRVLKLVKEISKRSELRIIKAHVPPPRTNVMPVGQDWSSVWPGPRSFHPASVPLPVRQGYNPKGAPLGKFANAELMKIPNFLHVTPPAIKKHCEAMKKFCTPWPENLTEENYEKHFPVEVVYSDYCFSSPSIREPLSRIVNIKVKLSYFNFDDHAKDKFLRLVEDRYDPSTDIVSITTDRCPYRRQNYEYNLYLLTALYHEAQKVEPWEREKTVADMEYYDWNKNPSRKNTMSIMSWPEKLEDDVDAPLSPVLQEYKDAVTALMHEGENDYTLSKYKEATEKLFNLHKPDVQAAASE